MAQQKAQKPKKTELSKAERTRFRENVIAFWIGLYFLTLFFPMVSPYTRYPLYVIICGGKLPLVGMSLKSRTYTRPGDPTYGVTPFDEHFFCTEEQAREAGFYHE